MVARIHTHRAGLLRQDVAQLWYGDCSASWMQPVAADGLSAQTADIFFKCEACEASLVVDSAAAGMTLNCQECGQMTTVPLATQADQVNREADLRRHLKENESQRTEVTGYINQLNIQLHRWQLRLQTLNERNAELKAEINGLVGEP